jgi:hypothetical protein
MTEPRVKDQDTGATLNTPAGGIAGGYSITGPTGAAGAGSTRLSYDKPDLVRTAAVTNAVYQNLMGRDATQKEIEKYHQEFLKYAASHPSNVSVSDATGERSSVSTGLTETDYITNLVKGTAEAGDYNAATTYFDAMKSAMNTFSGGY